MSRQDIPFLVTGSYASIPITLDPETASLRLILERPSAAEPSIRWNSGSRITTAIVVEIDGVEYRCEGSASGGERAPGRYGPISRYGLTWNLPSGFFAIGGEDPSTWSGIRNKRWGETARTSYRAFVEIELINGRIQTNGVFSQTITPAPNRPYRSSVAFQNSQSAVEDYGGDGQLSFSYTAGDAGSDRAAFIVGATSRDVQPTSASVTFDSGAPDYDLGDVTNTYWRGAGGVVVDSTISTGAKTVAFASSGGSGTQYSTGLGVVSMTGVDQTTPTGTVGTSAADSGTALSITVSTPASDSLVVDGWNWAQSATGAPTIGADQDLREETVDTDGQGYIVMSTQPGSDGGVMSWTKAFSGYEYVGMAIEFKVAAAGGGGPRGPLGHPVHGAFGGPVG